MLTRTQVIISTTGNIKDIQPVINNNREFFTIGDDYNNTVSIESIVAFIGLEVVANAKGIRFVDYINQLVTEVEQWKKDVTAETPIEEPKPVEEPEEKKEEPNASNS